MVLRSPTREYQPDRASRPATRTATHPADHTTIKPQRELRKITAPDLTNDSPYQLWRQDIGREVASPPVRGRRLRATALVGEPVARCPTEDVLCQPLWRLAGRAAGLADVGLPSSAARSALRAALRVTAAPAIRWVAARSGTGPDEVGIVTVTCRCSARWRAGSYGTPSCQHCHTMRAPGAADGA